MHNQLSGEKSLYLRQHAHQKVAWLPYAENSFDLAKKGISLFWFRSVIPPAIGVRSCQRECFEDEYVSSIMNRHFTCVLVDREERPDLDLIYMEAIRMFNQSAGWPLNAFCLPNGHPFWGGTYFPKEDDGRGLAHLASSSDAHCNAFQKIQKGVHRERRSRHSKSSPCQ